MDPAIRAAYEAQRDLAGKPFKSSCYAPFVSLYFHTNGDVLACCKNTTYPLGNVGSERLDDIWRGKRVHALRKALKDYKFGLGCEFCEWQIRGGQYDQVYTRVFDDRPLASEEAEWPTMMEFTLSNTCNLACIMCYGVLSSTIRAFREKLPPLPRAYDDQFFADLRKYLPHLKIAKFFGGEPFLAQENYRVWDMMIEDGVIIPCHVTTNGTQYNKKVERVLEALPVSLSISIDGTTKETVESVRVNAEFDVVMANMRRFLDYSRRKGTYMSLTYCLMRQNWHEFGDYLRLAESLDLPVFVNTVIDPVDCSLYTLEPHALLDIADRMAKLDEREQYSRLPKNGTVWQSGLAALRKHASDRQREGLSAVKDTAQKRRERTGTNHIAATWALIREGRLDDALAEVKKIPARHQDTFDGLVLAAHVLRQLNRLAEAETALEDAIALWNRAPNAFIERAWLRLYQGRYEEGIADAEQARALLSNGQPGVEAATMDVFAFLYSHVGRHEEAARAADRLLELSPKDAKVRVHRGWVFEKAGNYAAAVAEADAALALDPKDTEAVALQEMAKQKLLKCARS